MRATQRVFACGVGIAAALLAVTLPSSAATQTRATATSTRQQPIVKAPASKNAAQKPAAAPKAAPTRTSLARAATAARARRAAARLAQVQRAQQEAMTAHFKRDLRGDLVPDVRAAAAIIYDPKTGEVLWEANSHTQRSIASLTKIMTAVTFMADDPDLTQRVTVTYADTRAASVTHIRAGDILSYEDLLHLTLIASDNAAARALARTSEGGTAGFVARMNDMAKALGLISTHYEEPSGLNSQNVSSAFDMSHLISFAGADERLGPIMRKSEYEARSGLRPIKIHSTNRLLGDGIDVRGGKTGFISKAGYCLATLLQVPQGSPVAVVVLGASTSTLRFWEARHLFNWVVGRAQGIVGGDSAPAK